MKRIKQRIETNIDLAAAAKIFDKVGGKQIVGHARIAPAGGSAINIYTLEDGAEVMEDDAGKAVLSSEIKYAVRKNVEELKQNE